MNENNTADIDKYDSAGSENRRSPIVINDDARSYFGGKGGSGVYQAIINLMPPHKIYIEPFLGSGAVLRKKPPAQISIGIEKNKNTIDEYGYKVPGRILNQCGIEFLENLEEATADMVIYCDPPYLLETRTSNVRYECDFSISDHYRLLKIIKKLKCYVMVSGYDNATYNRELVNWWTHEFQAMTRGGVRTEKIWFNFKPGKIHYHTYAGKDYLDRQRIKRKADRWAKNFKKLPHAEKQAILAAMLQDS